MSSIPKQRFIFAPFTEMGIRGLGDTSWQRTGRLEEQSKVALTPIFVGQKFDQRILGCTVELTAYDIDADWENDYLFLKYQNQMVYVAFYGFGGGGFIDGPFRYTVYQEHLEGRGMRYVHRLTGRSMWLPWVSAFSLGWEALYKELKQIVE